jgi:hypothetical protein
MTTRIVNEKVGQKTRFFDVSGQKEAVFCGFVAFLSANRENWPEKSPRRVLQLRSNTARQLFDSTASHKQAKALARDRLLGDSHE